MDIKGNLFSTWGSEGLAEELHGQLLGQEKMTQLYLHLKIYGGGIGEGPERKNVYLHLKKWQMWIKRFLCFLRIAL